MPQNTDHERPAGERMAETGEPCTLAPAPIGERSPATATTEPRHRRLGALVQRFADKHRRIGASTPYAS
jgi:hypothetical protein